MSSTDFQVATMPKLTFPFHHHPLSSYTFQLWPSFCSLCSFPDISSLQRHTVTHIGYHCTDCGLTLHKECVDLLYLN
ncbi:hypothetical protein ARALYDRAFT_918512 [Arabidopsis lyrata subsp. lyrata]|uniref:Phorbol-ester/DAG-type domain-containing protein n=1 Tax=Arabidopsis lyrata subsp. lyrata TaxID=81972 RepID=D7MTN4_ARALL|nr:hypothetical protein ARALYDRAFT_918512 [Arabidopsis lyrata subsp. lyrata]